MASTTTASPDTTDAPIPPQGPLEADDGEHEATALNFVIVLRSGSKEGCPGAAPRVDVLTPSEGARVENRGGYEVTASVSDDMGLRDPPLLYYSTSAFAPSWKAADTGSAPSRTARSSCTCTRSSGPSACTTSGANTPS